MLQCVEDKRILDYLESMSGSNANITSSDVTASTLALSTIPRPLSKKEVFRYQFIRRNTIHTCLQNNKT